MSNRNTEADSRSTTARAYVGPDLTRDPDDIVTSGTGQSSSQNIFDMMEDYGFIYANSDILRRATAIPRSSPRRVVYRGGDDNDDGDSDSDSGSGPEEARHVGRGALFARRSAANDSNDVDGDNDDEDEEGLYAEDMENEAAIFVQLEATDEDDLSDSDTDSSEDSSVSSDDADTSEDELESRSIPRSRPGASAVVRPSGSFEHLPSLADSGSQPSRRASKQASKGDRGRNNMPFLPKYLEISTYGALCRDAKRRASSSGAANDNGTKTTASGTPPSVADCETAIARLAPDTFFKTLVQDTWPHYCTPAPTSATFNSLRLGYGLDLGTPEVGAASDLSSQRRQEQQQQQSQDQQMAHSLPLSSSSTFTSVTSGDLRRGALNGSDSPRQEFPSARAVSRRAKGSARISINPIQPLPSEWAPYRNAQNMTVESDRVEVLYSGLGRTDQDAAMILSNCSIPMHVGVYYFEAYVKSRGQSGYIGIGLSHPSISTSRLPGWDAGSWGYHGDDGNSFGGDGRGNPYGPGFKSGDTVGCGIDFMRRSIFFTRNGVFLGYAFKNIDTTKPLYPCVGMRTQGENIVANFGRSEFVFDICNYASESHEEALNQVQSVSLSPMLPKPSGNSISSSDDRIETVDGHLKPQSISALRNQILDISPGNDSGGGVDRGNVSLSIVIAHLLHNEHYQTAQALIENAVANRSAGNVTEESDCPKLAAILRMLRQQSEQRTARKRICKYIREGAIDFALGLLQDAYPAVLKSEPIVFQLRCRQFVELVRLANKDSIASVVPSDDRQLAQPQGALSGNKTEDMMDVDDSRSPALLSLSSITNAPRSQRHIRFGQLGNVQSMDHPQLVRALLEYGRQLQADYGTSPSAIVREGLVHTFSLLAYANPAQSPVAGLLDTAAREPLAGLVEMAIVASENAPQMSALECICRQTSAILSELSGLRNGAASLISLKHDFMHVPDVEGR
ncbi:hypothetical protein LPJ53_002618 [Coemansia erecta]|uniref:SPRY-domain-containing protein n=1 Tax=Coemansia erecta TaxID=147472 RepID=A0A9W7Y3W0_9FUNG|nr:hypothetical protein LPJ53_002618 [Coemansia erecta]